MFETQYKRTCDAVLPLGNTEIVFDIFVIREVGKASATEIVC